MGEEQMAAAATVESLSPKNRLKFLCSFGGKILPRPSDMQLKYVGGDTRIVAVPRSVSFSELKEKMASMCRYEVAIKFQLMPEELDLDALVSVKSDEDVHHMADECDRQESSRHSSSPPSNIGGRPLLRVFLFPTNPESVPTTANNYNHHHLNHQYDYSSVEQRYIDAINGVIKRPSSPPTATATTRTSFSSRPVFTISSTGSSPTSVNDDNANLEFASATASLLKQAMHKANSTPNLYAMAQQQAQGHCHHQQQSQWRMNGLQRNPGRPLWRMGSGPVGGGGYEAAGPRPLHKLRYNGPSGSAPPAPRTGRGGCSRCCHVEEFGRCSRRSGEGDFCLPHMKRMWG